MLRKFMVLAVAALLLTTLVSSAFAQCKTDKQLKDGKSSCCQCCCCNCAK